MKKILTIAVMLVFGIQFVQAQTYAPDRPGIGTGSFITPENMIGVEAGLEFSIDLFKKQASIGQLMMRYGVNDKLEIRTFLGSYSIADEALIGGSRTNSGFQDMAIGTKYNLFSDDDKATVSALAEVSVPVGTDEFTSGEFVPSLGVLADFSLQKMWSVSSNLGYTFGPGNLDDFVMFTLTPGFVISNSANIGGYFGYAGIYDGNANENWIEAGLTIGLESGAQLDMNLGYETEWELGFVGIGFAQGF